MLATVQETHRHLLLLVAGLVEREALPAPRDVSLSAGIHLTFEDVEPAKAWVEHFDLAVGTDGLESNQGDCLIYTWFHLDVPGIGYVHVSAYPLVTS